MKQYIYSPAEAGFAAWPSGELRLDGFEVTTDPSEADIFVSPGNLSMYLNVGVQEGLRRLPYFTGRESRHVLFDVSDNFRQAIGLPCIFLKCDIRSWMLKDDPNSVAVAWPVEDYAECVDILAEGFKFDVSFHGWLSTDTRRQSSQACLDNPGLRCDIARYEDFTGYIYHEPEGIRRRAEFRRSMRESRLALCPESIPGVLPYRFFEAMSAGRVPVLVSSDFVLPFTDEIPYDKFILRVSRDDASRADVAIQEFIKLTTDEELIRMGKLAREYWVKYLNREDWARTMAYSVDKKLKELALCA